MIRPLFLSLLVLVGAALPGQNEAKTISTFKKAFAAAKGKKPGAPLADKRAALLATEGLDSAKVATALVTGWKNFDAELAALDAKRVAVKQEIKEIESQMGPRRTLPRAQFDRINALRPQSAQLRSQTDGMRTLLLKVGQRISRLERRDSLLYLLKNVCGHKKSPLPLQLQAARAVGSNPAEVLKELTAAINRAKKPAAQIALLDALALAGKPAHASAGSAIKLLKSKESAVAERAALALAKLAVKDAIEPMITLLGRSTGQMQMRVAAALEVLTGQQFGDNIGAWHAWWKSQGESIMAGTPELGKGIPSNRKSTNENYYFGIPQSTSDAILYVIDCSGSMKAPVRLDTGRTTAGGKPEETTRLEACKKELIRALGLLNPKQKFAIIWYNNEPHWWEERMQPATKDATKRAIEFVRKLNHGGSTNIHDALQDGFELAGRGSRDKYYGIELDTVFLLTDGSPTKPDGSQDSTEQILVGVRQWNPLKRVTIHTIAIGRNLNSGFLSQLAKENGGEFRQF